MNYIILDLEFNQPFDFEDDKKTALVPECPFEIIQIGAVKMDEDLNILEKANFLVKPKLYDRMHPYVKKITGISDGKLQNERTFPEIYPEFLNFLGEDEHIFCIWGNSDMNTMFRNTKYHKLNDEVLSKKYIDVQTLASEKLEKPSGTQIGLENAVESFQLAKDTIFHDALNDALYTAKIFQLVKKDTLTIKCFNTEQHTEKNQYAVRTNALFRAIEKELGRKLHKKERDMYKKVYYMGRAKQFDVLTKVAEV